MDSLEKTGAAINSFSSKRPIGSVVAIIERPPCRVVVGFPSVKQWITSRVLHRKSAKMNKKIYLSPSDSEYIDLTPTDPKFSNMVVPVKGLPNCIKKRLENGDASMEMELVAAQIGDWEEGKFSPSSSCCAYFWAMRKLKEEEILGICAYLLSILLLPLILMMLY